MKKLSIKSSTAFKVLRFIFLFSGFIATAFAAEDSDYVQVARERLYVGGLEESDLKVQQLLLTVDGAGSATRNEAGNDANKSESEEGF